jgi:hypothetical protein
MEASKGLAKSGTVGGSLGFTESAVGEKTKEMERPEMGETKVMELSEPMLSEVLLQSRDNGEGTGFLESGDLKGFEKSELMASEHFRPTVMWEDPPRRRLFRHRGR